MSNSEFETILLEAVDQGLTVLGESSKISTFFHLEKSYGMKKQDIPEKTEAFANAVEKLFGPGAKFILTLVSKNLCQKAGLSIGDEEITSLSFAETAAKVKKLMER